MSRQIAEFMAQKRSKSRRKIARSQAASSASPSAGDIARAKSGRTVAVVLALTMVLWVGVQWLAPQLGVTGNYAFLFDLMALAAFLWALIVTVGLLRNR